MPSFDHLQVAVKDRIAWLTINRPKVLNALSRKTLEELRQALALLQEDEGTGALVLTGAGSKAFVAGADIREFSGLDSLAGREFARQGQALFTQIETFPKPVIAAINGFCLGGGCELALACHLRIASETATFGQPEVKLGIIPGYGGTQRLPRLIGKGRALEMILSGERIGAEEALRIGLVNRVVGAQELLGACEELAGRILANAPLAVRYSISAVQAGLEMPLESGLELEATLFGLSLATRDAREGVAAFAEKRKAEFKGK